MAANGKGWEGKGWEGMGWDGKLRSRHQKFATHFKHPSLRPTAVLGERDESKTLTKKNTDLGNTSLNSSTPRDFA